MIKDKIIKKAFTMSELLIAIGVIRIIALMAMPNLVIDSNNKEYVSQMIKVTNTLTNAFKEAEVTDDIMKKAQWGDLTNGQFTDIFERHLNTLSSCDDEYDVCLTDGSRIKYANMISTDKLTCGKNKYESGKPIAFKNTCMTLIVDINRRKGPNKDGKDIYRFFITQNGLFPDGKTDSCEYGVDCGSYVLSNHKIWDGDVAEMGEYGTTGKVKYLTSSSDTCEDGYTKKSVSTSSEFAYKACLNDITYANFHQCYLNNKNGIMECYDLKGELLLKPTLIDSTGYRITPVITDYEPVNGSYYLGALAECESRGLVLRSSLFTSGISDYNSKTYAMCSKVSSGTDYNDPYYCARIFNVLTNNSTSYYNFSSASKKLPIICATAGVLSEFK